MTDHRWNLSEKISGTELAEIEVLMQAKGVPKEELQRVLDSKAVESLEDLDSLTARNFLHYLRSLQFPKQSHLAAPIIFAAFFSAYRWVQFQPLCCTDAPDIVFAIAVPAHAYQ